MPEYKIPDHIAHNAQALKNWLNVRAAAKYLRDNDVPFCEAYKFFFGRYPMVEHRIGSPGD